MELVEQECLADELRLAIAYTPAIHQSRVASFLAFDQRLARIIAQSNEPMLAQVRIAWWRDTLAKPIDQRPEGDLVLDAMGKLWAGEEKVLVGLADGWEKMLIEPPIPESELKEFVAARAAPFVNAVVPNGGGNSYEVVNQAGRIWAFADTAVNTSDSTERTMILEHGLREASRAVRLPRTWRGLAVLQALAMRSLRSGGAPLMTGRGAAWTALRVGLTGR